MNIQYRSEYVNDVLLYNHCIKMEQEPGGYRTHYHDKYEILFIKEGAVAYQIGETRHTLSKYSLVFTRPNVPHRICIDGESAYDRYDCLFDRKLVPDTVLAKIPDTVHVLNFEANPIVIQLFEKMDYYCENLRGEDLGRLLSALVAEVVTNILIQISSAKAEFERNPLTGRVIDYIDENILSVGDMDALCAALSISKSYLYQIFLQDLNTTPKRYIVEKRLNMARREILLGAKAAAVYSQYGFSDYSAFFRAYKKYFGYSPAATQKAAFIRNSFDDVVVGHVV